MLNRDDLKAGLRLTRLGPPLTLQAFTDFGALLDPAADRLYILAALLGLGLRGVVPWWAVAPLRAAVARTAHALGMEAEVVLAGDVAPPRHVAATPKRSRS